jgi:hypothetical protein
MGRESFEKGTDALKKRSCKHPKDKATLILYIPNTSVYTLKHRIFHPRS